MTLPHRQASERDALPLLTDRDAAERRSIARALAGDEAAFESVVRAHYPGLCDHVLRYVGCPEVAEDLVLELFAHLWGRRHRSIPLTVDRGYLYRSARNRALDYLRRQRVATVWVDRMSREAQEPSDDAPDNLLECSELAAAAARAVAELPEQRRRIFVLCREHDMSYAEVGERLGISPRTVNTQMTRALKTLRVKLAPYFPCT
ncbi:MAG TPA: RNA polymerase sigma-70 factor [Gemmatimonadaceae bacterium]|nr:RNA polymerase sigma-70 factor [Gemmatimonadaceae bacterium]